MKNLRWFHWLAILCMILPACSLANQVQSISPTATPLPPALEPSPVPPTPTPVVIVVTSTAAPTDTPLPATPTTQPATQPARPTNPPVSTDTPVPTIATVIMYNGLGRQLTVDLAGPELKHFSLSPKATKEFQVKPGTYNYTLTATGFYPLRGAVTFAPGTNTWNLGKSKP